uniref:TLC domain-containing protein n=1 Tax=Leptocylindrus aporus TaxID=1398097 RepID=A0A7S0K9L3_9STRA|mmetsp:Transcript_312/g.387  ORF Transcript_312/g.387 Transcript_312/m.387 type:complete len:382 (+) Transcript_312:107-1252(+)
MSDELLRQTNEILSIELAKLPATPIVFACFVYEKFASNFFTCPEESIEISGDFPTLTPFNSDEQSLMEYMFHTNSTELGCLTTVPALTVLAILVVLMRAFKAWFKPKMCDLGRRIGVRKHGLQWEKDNEERIMKFGEYCFRLLFHSCMSCFGLYFLGGKPWWDNFRAGATGTRHIWLGYPFQVIEPSMQWYYLIQASYNFEEVLFLTYISFQFDFKNMKISFAKTVRGDFREMMTHHIVTNCLIFLSSHYRFTIIGSMIFMIHDISDVPVDLSKLANFVKAKTLTVICFITLLVFWLSCRLIVFPFVIFRSIWTESALIINTSSLGGVNYLCLRLLFSSLIGSLILLHVYWFFLLIRILLVLAFKGETHDLSEHKDGEKQD